MFGAILGGSIISGAMGADAAKEAAQIQANASKYGIDTQKAMFDQIQQQQAPYRGTGVVGLNEINRLATTGEALNYDILHPEKPAGIVRGTGYFSTPYSMDEFKQGIDPGYQFRLQQGQDLARRQGNVGGGLVGGNVMKGLEDYTQQSASNEFLNAFNRNQSEKTNIYNRLASMAGLGQASLNQTNQAGMNTAGNIASLATGGANAAAAGTVGAANAIGGGIQGAANAYSLNQLLNPSPSFSQTSGWSNGGSGMVNVPGQGSMSISDFFKT